MSARRLASLALLPPSIALAVALWQHRPPFPPVPGSLTLPVTTTFVQRTILLLAWAALLLLLAVVAAYAAAAARQREHRASHPAIGRRRARPRSSVPPAASPALPLRVTAKDDAQPTGSLSLRLDLELPGQQAERDARAAPDADAEPAREPTLGVRLLGPFALDGAPLPRRAATRELIAYLALHHEGATRDQLLEALWPDTDPRSSRPRLWQAITEARRTLADALVRDDDGRYSLDRSAARVDADELTRLLDRAQTLDPRSAVVLLDRANELWRGAPLDGADYPWAESDMRRLRGAQVDLMQRVGAARLAAGDARAALDAAERAIAIDELHEPCWRLALDAEAALGLRDAIVARYDTLTRLLDDRLGVQPAPETVARYRRLLAQPEHARST